MGNASDQNRYRLISGVFNPDEASELLMALLEDKISFHQRNNWSLRERFGKSTAPGEKRIGELRQTRTDLIALLQEARDAGLQLHINCNIDITLAPE